MEMQINKYATASLTAIIATLLLLGIAFAVEVPTTASVTVNEFVDVTITDLGSTGITFGSFDPGTTDNVASPNPAVDITVESPTNIDINVYLKGTDWTGPAALTLAATNVRYDDDADLVGDSGNALIGTLTTAYPTSPGWLTVTAPSGGVAVTTSVYHWLDIPAYQYAGAYTSTFTYKADSS